ncbi:hypothetical protein GBAR_LOCUS15967, partial [Geodia barretti]
NSANSVPGLCSARTDDRRLSAIRDNILTKLSPFLPFDTSHWWSGGEESAWNGSRSVDPALLSAYEALSQVLDGEDEPTSCIQPDRGRGTPAFAKRISLFFPVNDSVIYAPLERHQTDEENNHSFNNSTLPIRYTFIFTPALPSLPVYSAELRLFKRVVSSCKDVFENVEVFYVRRRDGEEQERLFVTSKNLELVKDEYDSLDVTEAVSKWVENRLNGSLELEVIVNCPFSIKTGSLSPPSIEFVRDKGTTTVDDLVDTR